MNKLAQVGSLPLPSSLLPAALTTATSASATNMGGKGASMSALHHAHVHHHHHQLHHQASLGTVTLIGGGGGDGTNQSTPVSDLQSTPIVPSIHSHITPLSLIDVAAGCATTPASICPSPAPTGNVAIAEGGQQQLFIANTVTATAAATAASTTTDTSTTTGPQELCQVEDSAVAIAPPTATAILPNNATPTAPNTVEAVAEDNAITTTTAVAPPSLPTENIPQEAPAPPPQQVVLMEAQPTPMLVPGEPVDSSTTNVILQQQIPLEVAEPENIVEPQDRTESSLSLDTTVSFQESPAVGTVETSPEVAIPPIQPVPLEGTDPSQMTQMTTVTAPSEQTVPVNVSFAVTSIVTSTVAQDDGCILATPQLSMDEVTSTASSSAPVAAALTSIELEHSSSVDTNESPQVTIKVLLTTGFFLCIDCVLSYVIIVCDICGNNQYRPFQMFLCLSCDWLGCNS